MRAKGFFLKKSKKMSLPEGVDVEAVMKVYNAYKRRNAERSEWYKTEEGKEYNRQKAREYYLRHKDLILEKRAKRYEEDRNTLLDRAKEYYKVNAEEINAKARAKREA